MIVEAVLILDDACRDATIGLAAQLAAVPAESGDSAPTTPTIYNEAEHGQAARDSFPDGAGPYLLISTQALDEATPLVRPVQDMRVGVVFRYLIRDKNTEDALRSASYTYRALLRMLGKLFTTSAGEALRIRNQVGLYDCNTTQGGLLAAPETDTAVSWALTCSCSMRDGWANT